MVAIDTQVPGVYIYYTLCLGLIIWESELLVTLRPNIHLGSMDDFH